MITTITCLMLYYPSISDDDEMNIGVSKLTSLEPTIKHLMNETRLCGRKTRNLVNRGHNTRVKIFLMETFTLK